MNPTLLTLNFCTCNICIHAYHILLVNSRGYYKFQVEIGAAANQNYILKLCIRYKFIIVLRGDYLSKGGDYLSHGY